MTASGDDSAAPSRTPFLAMRRVLIAVVSVSVVVAPVAYMLVPVTNATGQAEDFLTSMIAALAVTGGVLFRRRDRYGTSVAILLGVATGLVLAIFIASSGYRGFGVLIPPAAGLALGLLDGIGDRPLTGFREPVGYGAAFGGLIGVGLITLQGPTVFLIGVVIGGVIGTYLGMWGGREPGQRAGLRAPPLGLAALVLALLTLFTTQIRSEFISGRSATVFFGPGWTEAIVQTLIMQVLVPVFALLLGVGLARWLKPRLAVYDELVEYLRVMYVPIGAFSIGSAFIVLVFAGIYGSLFKLWSGHFGAMASDPTTSDWIFFAIYTSVAADFSAITPASNVAHLMVATQVVVGIGWALVMFAAVMTLIQSRLARLAQSE